MKTNFRFILPVLAFFAASGLWAQSPGITMPQSDISYRQTDITGSDKLFSHEKNAECREDATPYTEYENMQQQYRAFADELKRGNYRPTEIITRNKEGKPSQKIIYYWDKEGRFSPTTEAGLVVITQHHNGAEWTNYMRRKIVEDENGDMVEYYIDQGAGNTWKRSYRFTATYDESHNQLTANQTHWVDTGWQNRLRWENTFDENNHLITRTYFNLDDNGNWTNGLKETFEYDAAGNNTKKTQYSYLSGSYQESLRFEYEYDQRRNVTAYRQATKGVYDIQWEYIFDESGKQMGSEYYKWINNMWDLWVKTEATYENELLMGTETQSLDTASDTWYISNREDFEYKGDTTVKTESRYTKDAGKLLPFQRTTAVSNEATFLDYVLYETYAANLSSFFDFMRDIYTYDENFNILTQRYERASGWNPDWSASAWTAYVDYTFTYDEHGNGASVNAPVRNPEVEFFLPYDMHLYHVYILDEAASYAEAKYLDLNDYIHVSALSFDRSTAEMQTGETLKITPAVSPQNASNPELVWYSSNPKIVDVDLNGLITAKAEGQAIVTARSLDQNIETHCIVSVLSQSGEVAAPVFLPASGEIHAGTQISIVCTTPGAAVHYTTDESEPSASSPLYSQPIPVNADITIKAIAILEDRQSDIVTARYTVSDAPVDIEEPVFRPAAGAVAAGTQVSITTATSGALIHFTTDGSEPSSETPQYTTPISIDSNMTIKAIAVLGTNSSDIVTAVYTIAPDTVQIGKPLFNPAPGEVPYGTMITLTSSTRDAKIYYTLDKSEPSENSSLYTEPIEITDTTTITAIAILGKNKSEISTATYTTHIEVKDPIFSLPDGVVVAGAMVGITCPTKDADIYYTLDGSDPDESSILYRAAITIEQSVTIKAIAIFKNIKSNIVTGKYTVSVANEMQDDTDVRIYPNPNTGRFYVDLPRHARIEVFSPNGTMVRSVEKATAGRCELNIDRSGLFFIRLTFDDKHSVIKRIIVR